MRYLVLLRLSLALLAAAVMPLTVLAKAQEQQATQEQIQPGPLPDQDSVANAALRSRAAADKSGLRRVYTEDDVSSLQGPVSVVGEDRSEPAAPSTPSRVAKPPAAGEAKSATKNEAYWRGRYQMLRQKIAAVDKRIADKQEEIKKYGPGGMGTDLGQLMYCHPPGPGQIACFLPEIDRTSQLKDLENQKAVLLQLLDELQDEARKAGVEPGWVR